jgi:hypothetical protein
MLKQQKNGPTFVISENKSLCDLHKKNVGARKLKDSAKGGSSGGRNSGMCKPQLTVKNI